MRPRGRTIGGVVGLLVLIGLVVAYTSAGSVDPAFALSMRQPMVSGIAGAANPTDVISILRRKWSGKVVIGPVRGLPRGVSASLGGHATLRTSAASVLLTVVVRPATAPGSYRLVVHGRTLGRGRRHVLRARAVFTLKVPPAARFTISGHLSSPLGLGRSQTRALDLSVTNPETTAMTVTDIRVKLASVSPRAGAQGACSQSGPDSPNFRIVNLPPRYAVKVPPDSTRRLAAVGGGRQPIVTWLDQSWNQVGCLGAVLHFSYAARGWY